jgi:plastocyanin
MTVRIGLRVACTVALLLGSLMIAIPASAAATTYQVEVGAPLFGLPQANGAPADGMRFYAPPLNVHKGDVIAFTMQGFHTATLLPANVDADQWVADNALGFGKPYSFVVPDPDEGAGGVKANNAVALPPASGCGDATDPCAYDGTQVVNSGLFPRDFTARQFTFSVTINANAGSKISVLCLIHLAMRLDIAVVADTETATTQHEIDAFAGQKVVRDARQASKAHLNLLATVKSSGHGTLDAFVGYDGDHFALDAMYPRKLELKKGQRVTWHFDQLAFEDHTVTFPQKRGVKIANSSLIPFCDPDGDPGTMPDEPANPDATTLAEACPSIDQIEFDISPNFGPPAGDGVATSTKDFESSGLEGANAGLSDPYTLKFAKRTTEGPYTFVCMIHPFMHGKVLVG